MGSSHIARRFWARRTITQRIALGFVTLAACALGLVVANWVLLQEIERGSQRLSREVMPAMVLTSRPNAELLKLRVATLWHMFAAEDADSMELA